MQHIVSGRPQVVQICLWQDSAAPGAVSRKSLGLLLARILTGKRKKKVLLRLRKIDVNLAHHKDNFFFLRPVPYKKLIFKMQGGTSEKVTCNSCILPAKTQHLCIYSQTFRSCNCRFISLERYCGCQFCKHMIDIDKYINR